MTFKHTAILKWDKGPILKVEIKDDGTFKVLSQTDGYSQEQWEKCLSLVGEIVEYMRTNNIKEWSISKENI